MSRYIYYTSDAYSNLHHNNLNSHFRNSIDKIQLDYLPSEPIQCSVVNITFTLKKRIETGSFQLGLRSSLPTSENIRSSFYDDIIYTFTISASDKRTVNYQIPPTQYIYFNTNKEKLVSAKFEIVDLTSNRTFDLIDHSSEPTVVKIVVQQEKMTSFPILLESNDSQSLQFYSQNDNMNFTICLPERQELQGENWGVTCKGVQTTASIWNIQDATFFLDYSQYFVTATLNGMDRVDFNTIKSEEMSIPPGYYSSKGKIVDLINKFFVDKSLPITVSSNYKGNTKISSSVMFDAKSYLLERSAATLTLSSNLANLLGFTDEPIKREVNFLKQKVWQAPYPVDLSYGLPGIIFIQMNILQNTLVGHLQFPILQMLSLKQKWSQQSILHYVVMENQENLLKTKLFSEINVKITDVHGSLVHANNDFATIIHLVFHQLDKVT